MDNQHEIQSLMNLILISFLFINFNQNFNLIFNFYRYFFVLLKSNFYFIEISL